MIAKMDLSNRKVFIAGGSGLLGLALAAKLETLGADYCASYFTHPPPANLSRYRHYDLTRMGDCLEALSGVTDLLMCAGVTFGIKMIRENPSALIIPNLEITANLLEAARLCRVERVVFVSSGTVYQEIERPIREDDLDLNVPPCGLYTAVGNVNRYLEGLCRFYFEKYGIKIGIVRPSNIYGVHDHFEENRSHVLPALIRRALNKENPFKIWGGGKDVRDFIYVDDAADAILRVLDNYCVCDPLNLGSGSGVRICDAAQIILEVCGHRVEPIYDASAPTSVPYRVLDVSKLETVLGPLARTPLEEGIRKTVEWYHAFAEKRPREAPVEGPKESARFHISGIHSGFGKFLHEELGGEGFGRGDGEQVISRWRNENAEVIIHCAFNPARNVSSGNLGVYLNDNVELTRNLCAIPHRKFIYISSVDVYGAGPELHREDELIFPDRLKSIYAMTKLMAESIVRERCPNHLILRCSALLGRYARRSNFKILMEDPKPVLTLTENSVFNYVLQKDLAEFIRFAVERDLTGIYNIVSSENTTIGEVARQLKKDVRFGDYFYDTGRISNEKAAGVFPLFAKTSLAVVAEFSAASAASLSGAGRREGK